MHGQNHIKFVWYHIDIPVDLDFYGLMLKSPVDFLESTLHVVKTVTGLFITPVWPTVAPIQSTCVKCVPILI